MSLKTTSFIFVGGCVVCKFSNNEILIKPLKWLKEEQITLPDKIVGKRDITDDDNVLQKLADGNVTFDDITRKYFY